MSGRRRTMSPQLSFMIIALLIMTTLIAVVYVEKIAQFLRGGSYFLALTGNVRDFLQDEV